MDKIDIQFNDVHLAQWNVNGPFRKDYTEPVNLDMNSAIKLLDEEKILQVHIKVDFSYPDSKKIIILSGKVITSFKISNEGEKQNPELWDLPDQHLITMLSISISHARAIIVQQSKSVGLLGFIIPIVNPTEIYQKLKENIENPKESTK